MLRSRILMLPSISQCGACTVPELAQLREGGWCIGEEKGLALGVFGHLDGAIVDPVGCAAERLGELGHGEIAGHAAGVRLMALLQDAMLEANVPHRARQDLR